MPTKTAGRAVGALLLLAFALYLPGSALTSTGSGGTRTAAGALLMLANSFAVAGIGLIALPVMRPHSEFAARAYLLARTVEAIMLAVGVVFLLLLIPLAADQTGLGGAAVLREGNRYAYAIGMLALGVGSLPFWWAARRARLVPRPLAVWGLVGYGLFAAGMVLDILGYGVGTMLSVPGGLFEIAVGILLAVRGFATGSAPPTGSAQPTDPPVTAPAPA